MPFVTVAKTTDLPAGSAAQVLVNNRKIAIFNLDGVFYAIEDTCSHRGAPLSEGSVMGEEVECPLHGARFNLKTGAHLCPPAPKGVAAFRVQVSGDDVQIDVS
jgi:3-phenylpropionate/trans-cinnamate dioxygenase ferredoxin component